MNKPLKFPFFAGVFLLSFSLLACQFLLTRFLSIVYYYHFVFLIVSVVMFGFTAGALLVYSCPGIYPEDRTVEKTAKSAMFGGMTMLFCFISIFYLPCILNFWGKNAIPCLFPILAVPFVYFGIAFSLLLTRFPASVGKIYAVNLLGSAAGCLGAYFILNNLNGPTALCLLTVLCLFAGLFFLNAEGAGQQAVRALCWAAIALVLAGGVYNQQKALIRPLFLKGGFQPFDFVYSKWNFFSFVSIDKPTRKPFGWGYSPKVKNMPVTTDELMIQIDADAGTVMTGFRDLKQLDYLKYDITNLAYYIRPPSSVLVIGAGGGRDLLSGLVFNARKITGVELNKDIIDIVWNKFPFAASQLRRYPQIQVYNDDGRAFTARSKESYDLIQSSLVDSFAAAGTGAFALSENSLYTKEAWGIYLRHLTPRGILTFSRWYTRQPFEIYRILSLAQSALKEMGIPDPRSHVAIMRTTTYGDANVGTILVSKTAFTPAELQVLNKVCADMGFEVVLSAEGSADGNFGRILEGNYALNNSAADISPSTDNRPFYFYFSHFRDFFSADPIGEGAKTLRKVCLWIVFFGAVFILFPMVLKPEKLGLGRIRPAPAVYFVSIGLGFMLMEISLIQRLGLFLGHPVWGLTVVLFSLLLACGIGSFWAPRLGGAWVRGVAFPVFLALILGLCFFLPPVLSWATALEMPAKIALAGSAVFLSGLLMGLFFPTGMARAAGAGQPLVFYWAVNGFASMCASALATILLINLGFQFTVFAAFLCYLAAFAAARSFI